MKIREYKREDLFSVSKIHVDTWKSTYKKIVPEEFLNNLTYEKQNEKWLNRLFNNGNTNEFMYVAENEFGEVVGFSTAALNDKDCKIHSTLFTLYILKECQNRGIGRLLVKTVAARLKSLGAESIVLWAFAENNACNFYEHLGGSQADKNVVNIAGVDLVEVSYQWEDINSLADL